MGDTSRYNSGLKKRLQASALAHHPSITPTNNQLVSQETRYSNTTSRSNSVMGAYTNKSSLAEGSGLRSSLLPDVNSKMGQTVLTIEPKETPSMNAPLSDTQIEDLLNKVNMNNVFLSMANSDQDLITLMKDTIEFQKNYSKKREKLVHAISHNVRYLASIHRKNNNDLKLTKEHLAAVLKWNEKLQEENHDLTAKNSVLKKD